MALSWVTFLGGGVAAAEPEVPAAPQIIVLSGRADLVSGGDALVEVKLSAGTEPGDVRVTLDGRDITHEFALRPNVAKRITVVGSIKWLENRPFDTHDLARLLVHRGQLPG